MSKRNIVKIDPDQCDGCGLCATACAEGAIRIVAGKAQLISESYCDGLGACLGECPRGAITIEVRAAAEFDPAAVEHHLSARPAQPVSSPLLPMVAAPPHYACPGSGALALASQPAAPRSLSANAPDATARESRLVNWPVQLMLVPEQAPYYQNADLLIVADCVPVAAPDFQSQFLDGQTVLMGCPKLDDVGSYRRKLASILAGNDIRSVAVLRMQVPCCAGLARLAQAALTDAGKPWPVAQTVVSIRGQSIRT
jgi:NAD-dependent dihydropyrimidine dehydrogenase PreA subunit